VVAEVAVAPATSVGRVLAQGAVAVAQAAVAAAQVPEMIAADRGERAIVAGEARVADPLRVDAAAEAVRVAQVDGAARADPVAPQVLTAVAEDAAAAADPEAAEPGEQAAAIPVDLPVATQEAREAGPAAKLSAIKSAMSKPDSPRL
jgi:hypothetical protein